MSNNQSNELSEFRELVKLKLLLNDLPIDIDTEIELFDRIKSIIQDRERQARINEHELLQHQATVNLKSAKAVAGWSELRIEQLKGDKS